MIATPEPPIHHNTVGHRGYALAAPENTAASFNAAKRAGLSWVEFEIQRCATGEWVVFHDETLDRTSNGKGPVREAKLAQLKTLDIGSWFGPLFAGEKILTLEEVLTQMAELDLHPNIEVKFFEADDEVPLAPLAYQLGQQILAVWPKDKPQTMVSSFDLPFLIAFRKQYPDWPIGYLVEDMAPQHLDTMREYRFDTLNVDKESILTYMKTAPLPSNVPILVYTVNDRQTAQKLLAAGVVAIFSDKADLLR